MGFLLFSSVGNGLHPYNLYPSELLWAAILPEIIWAKLTIVWENRSLLKACWTLWCSQALTLPLCALLRYLIAGNNQGYAIHEVGWSAPSRNQFGEVVTWCVACSIHCHLTTAPSSSHLFYKKKMWGLTFSSACIEDHSSRAGGEKGWLLLACSGLLLSNQEENCCLPLPPLLHLHWLTRENKGSGIFKILPAWPILKRIGRHKTKWGGRGSRACEFAGTEKRGDRM